MKKLIKIITVLFLTIAASDTLARQVREVVVTGRSSKAPVMLSKTLSQEVNAQNGSFIRVVSAAGKLAIKNWNQQKVKVTIEIEYDSAAKQRSDEEWFEDLGVSIKPFSQRVDILTRRGSNAGFFSAYHAKPVTVAGVGSSNNLFRSSRLSGTATRSTSGTLHKVIPSTGTASNYRLTSAKTIITSMTIQIPAGCKLDVDNEYGDVVIGMNLEEAKLDISNGTLDAGDIKDLTFTGKYCNANLGDIGKAEIEFTNGTFRARTIGELDMDSKSSTIEYEKGHYLYMRSQGDHYTIDMIDKIDGRKVYGSVKVETLGESFDLDGNNVDIKIRDISPNVSLIKLNNKYGDVRLPVRNLKNYFVEFNGYYSTVFAPFQKEVVKEEEKKDDKKENTIAGQVTTTNKYHALQYSASMVGEVAPSHFTSTVGDVKGKHTRFEITCQSCTLDFK